MIADKKPGSVTSVAFEGFRVDLNLRRLYRNGELVKLTPKPFSTLEFLLENRDRVVSKEELLDKVWGGLRGISTVEQAVSQLRRTLGDDAAEARYIETVPGHGYRWIAQIPAAEAISSVGLNDDAAKPEPPHLLPVKRVRPAAIAITTSLIVLAFIGLLLTLWNFRVPARIARVAINGDTLIATNATGQALWKYVFDAPLIEAPADGNWSTQIVDMNGDGNREVLVAVEYAAQQHPAYHPEELFCFSSRGNLLWRYLPKIKLEFNTTKNLNGPWWISQMLVVPESHSSSVWIAVNHGIWWPAFVVKLSPSGAPTVMFVSSGMITALLRVRNKSGNYILAGGVNNEYRAASLALIPVNGPPATSPQNENSEFKCVRGCPVGKPYRYILLPRSELNAASSLPYNWVVSILRSADSATVVTAELAARGENAFYGFSFELQPKSVAYGDGYADLHRQAEVLGWIKHSFDHCPERQAPAIVKIADENGKWTQVSVPRTR